MDPDSPLPTMQLRMEVPRIQHTVQMYVTAEVEKLKAHIHDLIRNATIERADRLDEDIKKCVDADVDRHLKLIVTEEIYKQLSTPEIHAKVEAKVKALLAQLLP